MFQHSSEKLKVQSNTDKLQVIEEIQKEGLEDNHILNSENLNEEAALLLERILIHRFVRKIFGEAILNNIVPGGKWSKESSYFINSNDLPSTETISKNFSRNNFKLRKIYLRGNRIQGASIFRQFKQ